MRAIVVLIKKEIKELLTKQLLIPIVIMVFFFVFMGRMMTGEYKKAATPKPVIVADFDQTSTSNYIINILAQRNLIVKQLMCDFNFLFKQAQQTNINIILIIPESLEQKYQSFHQPSIQLYSLLNSLSPFSNIGITSVKSAINIVNESLGVKIIKQYNKDAPISTIKQPLIVTDYVNIKNRIIQGNSIQIKNAIRVQSIFIPIILLMVIVYISQMIAAAMGQEKENKTLETLLTLPVSRFQILVGKMIGASIVAILLSIIFLIGMRFYLSPMTQFDTQPTSIIQSAVTIGPSQATLYLVLTISLFLAILCAASLATLLSMFATDAKQAQVIITPINILAIFPYFIALMFDINSLSIVLKVILYLIPFTYPFIMSQALFFNQTTLIIGGMIYMIVFAIIVTVIAAKIFSSDRVFTAKLKIKR